MVDQSDQPRPRSWRFAAAPRADRDPRHPSFSRVRPESLVCPTEASVDAWLDAAAHARSIIKTSVKETWLPLEEGALKKLTVQRGVLINWFISKTGPGELNVTLPATFLNALARVVQVLAIAARRYGDAPRSPEPADTNSGYPLFTTHPAAKIVGAASGPAGAQTASAFTARAPRIAALTQTPVEAAFGYGLGGRSGPFYKWAPDMTPNFDGSWTAKRELLGHTQRNRIVQMSPLAINLALGPLFRRLKGARRFTPGMWRDGVTDHLAHANHPYSYEADISGFDASVTRQLQEAVASQLFAVWPDLRSEIELWLWAESRPLITPSWSLDDDKCTVSSTVGGTKSGLKLTSEMGTLYSAAAALNALWQQGRALTWPWQSDVSLAIQGDDVLLGARDPIDQSAFSAAYSEVGLTADLLAGDGFLAKHNGTSRSPLAPAIGRCIQQTMSNEHEPVGEQSAGILLLGLYARTAGSAAWPAAATNATWDVIMTSPFYQQFGHATLADFRRWVRTSSDAATMIIDSLKASASQPWITGVFRDAEHSPVAASIATKLLELGYAPTSLSIDAALDVVTTHLASQPESVRDAVILDGQAALAAGNDAADRWVLNFITKVKTTPAQGA